MMASLVVYDLGLNKRCAKEVGHDSLVEQVKQIEKHNFPKDEVMDFDAELSKRNTELAVVLNDCESGRPWHEAPVVAYMLHARVHGIALLHKICVADLFRRRGVGKALISRLIANLESQGCQRIQLWVDYQRPAAVGLYLATGFKKRDISKDYYGPDRQGQKWVYELNHIW